MHDVFFFQAEDGIRDIGVTGVQTCALPICLNHRLGEIALRVKMLVTRGRTERPRDLYYSLILVFGSACVGLGGRRNIEKKVMVESTLKYQSGRTECLNRSEERRVGKECRFRWSPNL